MKVLLKLDMDNKINLLVYPATATHFRRISEKLHTGSEKFYEYSGLPFKANWFSVFYALSKASKP